MTHLLQGAGIALVALTLASGSSLRAAPEQPPQLVQAPNGPTVSPPTRREIEAIQRKVQRAWAPPAGPGDVRGLQIDLRVGLDSDGTVLLVQTVDRARLAADPLFRRAAESAEAAVWRASPLPVPLDKIQFFKQFVLRFAPPLV